MSRVFRQALGDTHEQYDVLLTHLAVIRDIVHLAHSAASFPDLCQRLTVCLVEDLGYERATIVAMGDNDTLAAVGSHSQAVRLDGAAAPDSPHAADVPPPGLVTLARDVMAERLLLRWNGEGVGARRPLPPELEGSIVGLPLFAGGECIGAVLCEELAPRPWDLARQRAFELIGEIIDQVVTLTQVRLAMVDMQQQLEVELGVSLSRITDQEETLRAHSDRIAGLTRSLMASNQAKNSFLGLMSHELRTPLSVILGFGSILHDGLAGPVTREQEQHLDRVLSNGRHLNQLVDDMLFFVDAETTRIQPAWHRVDLAALLDEIVEALPESRKPNAPTFTLTIAPEAATLRSDPALLRRMLFHLISNAFKFTEHGTVTVDARRAPDGRTTEIRIIDTGIGIATEQLGRILDLFQQGDDTHARKRDGIGLGLNLVRACLVLLKGRCRVVAAPNGGTQAELLLPDGGDAVVTADDPPLVLETVPGSDGAARQQLAPQAVEGGCEVGGAAAPERVSRAAGSASPTGRTGSARG